MKTVLPLLSEYFGTFLFVLSVLSLSNPIFVGVFFIIALHLTKPVSGGLMNPALSVVMYLKNKLGLQEMFTYIAIQIAAAISAFYVFKTIQ
uniref:Major intrinsic protein n=1 Tax=viral metagenome TaxID=1070528 RepID=A0A6C0D684_9ZZZZ